MIQEPPGSWNYNINAFWKFNNFVFFINTSYNQANVPIMIMIQIQSNVVNLLGQLASRAYYYNSRTFVEFEL